MKQFKNLLISLTLISTLAGCASFKAERVDANESDEKALEITDKWVMRDTENVIKEFLTKMNKHRGFKRYMARLGRVPKIFVADVQNLTSNAYFPIDDLNDELLNALSESGEFILVDAAAREKILKEITYQNDGMVDVNEIKQVGKQAGADLLIFGNARMKPESRKGKTIKQYSVNLRMTDIERGVEVLRTRMKTDKYSDQSSYGW